MKKCRKKKGKRRERGGDTLYIICARERNFGLTPSAQGGRKRGGGGEKGQKKDGEQGEKGGEREKEGGVSARGEGAQKRARQIFRAIKEAGIKRNRKVTRAKQGF